MNPARRRKEVRVERSRVSLEAKSTGCDIGEAPNPGLAEDQQAVQTSIQ
jgi:hypothetical protein